MTDRIGHARSEGYLERKRNQVGVAGFIYRLPSSWPSESDQNEREMMEWRVSLLPFWLNGSGRIRSWRYLKFRIPQPACYLKLSPIKFSRGLPCQHAARNYLWSSPGGRLTVGPPSRTSPWIDSVKCVRSFLRTCSLAPSKTMHSSDCYITVTYLFAS